METVERGGEGHVVETVQGIAADSSLTFSVWPRKLGTSFGAAERCFAVHKLPVLSVIVLSVVKENTYIEAWNGLKAVGWELRHCPCSAFEDASPKGIWDRGSSPEHALLCSWVPHLEISGVLEGEGRGVGCRWPHPEGGTEKVIACGLLPPPWSRHHFAVRMPGQS